MTKTQILQLAAAVLMIGLVILFMNSRSGPPPPVFQQPALSTAGALRTSPETKPATAAPQTSASSAGLSEEPIVTRDPFQLPPLLKEVLRQKELAKQKPTTPAAAPAAAPQAQPNLKLQGILWGTSQPRAIINRRIVSAGDTIDDATIVAVGKNSVTVSFGGQEYDLKLPTKGSGGGQSSGWPPQSNQQGGQSF